MQSSEDGHNDEPEPKQDKDLLIDDVNSQKAHAIISFNRSGGTILVECTLSHLKARKK